MRRCTTSAMDMTCGDVRPSDGRLGCILRRSWWDGGCLRCFRRIRGLASGPSCFTIEFNDGSLLKEGQTVFVTYDAAGGLQDSNGNSINPVLQIVINSSTAL